MGQASKRGTPEERKEKAIATAQAISDHRYQQEMEKERKNKEEWDKLSPKEQEDRVKHATRLANVYSMYTQIRLMNQKRR